MTEFGNTHFDERLEAYLDGVMAVEDRATYEAEIAAKPQLATEAALQARVDAALEHAFPLVAPPAVHLAAIEKHLAAAAHGRESIPMLARWPWLVGIASAAAAACLAFALWTPSSRTGNEPFFQPVPVAQVYTKTVAEGFEPYYECRDDDRFAETFLLRQGIALRLSKLPLGSMMKGLSYPGGLSRETTAMLCDVNGEPVMVFVDREEKDQPIAAENHDPALNVFRTERDGLVFYEVTPLEKPTMTDYLVTTE